MVLYYIKDKIKSNSIIYLIKFKDKKNSRLDQKIQFKTILEKINLIDNLGK